MNAVPLAQSFLLMMVWMANSYLRDDRHLKQTVAIVVPSVATMHGTGRRQFSGFFLRGASERLVNTAVTMQDEETASGLNLFS